MQNTESILHIYKEDKLLGIMSISTDGLDQILFAKNISKELYNEILSIRQTLPKDATTPIEKNIRNHFLTHGFVIINTATNVNL